MQLNDTFDPAIELADSIEWGEPKVLSLVEFGTMTVHVLSIYDVDGQTMVFRKTHEDQIGPFGSIDAAVAGILY